MNPTKKNVVALIEQRLSGYSREETLARLKSYGKEGPTIEEFLAGMEEDQAQFQKWMFLKLPRG